MTEVPRVIFLHVMGVFVPSFFAGNLINRFGSPGHGPKGLACFNRGMGKTTLFRQIESPSRKKLNRLSHL